MKLNELLNEATVDEIGVRGAFKAAGVPGAAAAIGRNVGRVVKGIGSTLRAGAKGYQIGAAGTPRQRARAGGGVTPSAAGTAPAASPGASTGEFDQLKAAIPKLNPKQKQELSAEIEKSAAEPSAPAAPAASAAPATPAASAAPATPARKKGDMIRVGQNALQYTGEPGKEWFIASGPMEQPNPATDQRNGIQTIGGKRFISADNLKQTYHQTESRKSRKLRKKTFEVYSKFLKQKI